MATVPTDVLNRLYKALQQQEPATVKAILEPLDNEERKALLTSNTSQIEERPSFILCKIQDPESLRVILEGISACDRLDLLLTNVNIPSRYSFNSYTPWLADFARRHHWTQHTNYHWQLESYNVINQSITDQEWLTLLHTHGTTRGTTLMYDLIDMWNENVAGLLKFLFDSVSSAGLVNLLQLKQGGPDNRVQTIIQNLCFRENGREVLQVLMQYIGKTELLCLFQTPYRNRRHQLHDEETVYDESLQKHLKVEASTMKEIATTVIHSIVELSESDHRFGDNGKGIAWEETLLHSVLMLNVLDNDDVVSLLSTRDGTGNTPLHNCRYFNTIRKVLEQIEDKNLRFQLILRKNDNGDTPLHVIDDAVTSENILSLLPAADMMSLLCIQNNQGNTILHMRLRDLETSDWTTFIREVRLQASTNPPDVLVKNCEGRTFLHRYLEEHRKALSLRVTQYSSCPFRIGTPFVLPILKAIGLQDAVHILCEKDENGEAPVHQICSLYAQLMPEVSDFVGETTKLLTETDRRGNTALHILAQQNPDDLYSCIVLKHLPKRELGKVFQIPNTDGNTPLHLLSTESAYLHILPQILSMIHEEEGVTARELMKIKNKVGATPLNIALISSSVHGNRHAFKKIVDVLGTGNILNILEINITLSEYETLCSYHSTADCEELLNNLDRCSRYYILYTMGNEACTDLRRFIQTLNDAELSQRKEEIAGFSNHILQEYILSIEEKLKYENGNSFFHLLAEGSTESDHASVRKLLGAMTLDQRHRVLSCQNFGRQLPLDCAKSYQMRRLLEWSYAQEGFYYLQSPPVVIMMYSTADRPGANEECLALEAAFPQFDVAVRRIENPRRQDILDTIMNEGQRSERISAMIVIIMSHGEQGSVCAADGDVRIQDILLQMQAAIPQGQPKVLLVQACQQRRPNQPSRTIAENVQSDPAPPLSQPRRTTKSELAASTSSQPLNTTHIYSRQSLSQDFSLQWRDFITMIATVPGGLAYRNQMIPMFAEEVKDSKNNGDIYEIFLKTHHRLQKLIPDQVPEFRSTLTQKLSLRNIFKS